MSAEVPDRVLSPIAKNRHQRQIAPSADDIAAWVRLHVDGRTYRDIAQTTVWSKATVQRYVVAALADRDIEQQAADAIVAKLPLAARPQTPEGRRRKAAEIKPYVEARTPPDTDHVCVCITCGKAYSESSA